MTISPRRIRPTASVSLGLMIATLSGCASDPFSRQGSDTREIASTERLQSIAVFELERPQTQDNSDAQSTDTQQNEHTPAPESIDLSLLQARTEALENNLGLASTLIAPEIAQLSVDEEWARFESTFTLSANWNESDSPTSSQLVGSQSRNQGVTPGVDVPLLNGGTASVRLPISRSSTNNDFATLNPAWRSDLEFSLSHELLRGAGRRATTHAIRLADLSRQSSAAQTKLEVIRVLADVDRSYWRLYASLQALAVVEQQREVAQAQLETAQRRKEAGTGTEVDVVRARSGLADRQEAIITAKNDIRLRQRELKGLINIPGIGVDSGTQLVVTSPPDPVQYAYNAEQLTKRALDERMEMLELEINLARDAANIAFARNQKLPLLSLAYTYRVNALAGSLGNAFDNLAQNETENWSVSLNAQVPIGNERAKASLAQSMLTRLQTLATRDARTQSITTEVLNAIDQLESTWQRILATQESVVLNARLLDAERRQFDVGRSTSNDVLDADANLANARLAEIRAVVEYQIAQIDLAVASGMLLGQARVDLPESRRADDPESTLRANEGVTDYHPLSGWFVNP